jgi:CHAT domain-containing protein
VTSDDRPSRIARHQVAAEAALRAAPVGAWRIDPAGEPAFARAATQARRALHLASQEPAVAEAAVANAVLLVTALAQLGGIAAARRDFRLLDQRFGEATAVADQWLSPYDHALACYEWALHRLEGPEGTFAELLRALDARLAATAAPGLELPRLRSLLDAASAHEWMGDYGRAEREVDDAAALVRRLRAAPTARLAPVLDVMEQYARLILAHIRFGRGAYRDAIRLFVEALPNASRDGTVGPIEVDVASALVELGRPQEALQRLQTVERQFQAHGADAEYEPAFLGVLGEALLAADQPHQALTRLLAARRLVGESDPDLAWRLDWKRGTALEALGRVDEALASYQDAVSTVDRLRPAPLGYRLDNALVADKLPLFRAGIALAARLDRAEVCCVLIELAKARMLTRLLATRRQPPPATDPNEREFVAINDRLDALEYAGYRSFRHDPQQAGQRSTLLKKRLELLERIRIHDPRWRTLRQPPPFDPARIQRILADRSATALTLFLDGQEVYAVLLDGSATAVAKHTLTPAVYQALKRYNRNLTDPDPQDELFDPAQALGLRATDLIPADLLARAAAAATLLVIPHGALHCLPWPALTVKGDRLFERCAVGMLPNLQLIQTLARPLTAEPVAALFGVPATAREKRLGPLAYAQEELRELAALYQGRLVAGTPITGVDATPAALTSLAARPDGAGGILHIACHATAVPDEPLASGLLLETGKLDAAEISDLRISFDEVVLSACSTGWRPERVGDLALVGDEMLGLPAAFLEAGAASVLVSIPPPRDEAAYAFSVRYHTARAAGLTPLAALRDTQLAMRDDPGPTWVGFVVYGAE